MNTERCSSNNNGAAAPDPDIEILQPAPPREFLPTPGPDNSAAGAAGVGGAEAVSSAVCLDGVRALLAAPPPRPPEGKSAEILAVAYTGRRGGRETVAHDHRQTFQGEHGQHLGVLRGLQAVIAKNAAALEEALRRLDREKKSLGPYTDVAGEGSPWTAFSRLTVIGLAVLSILMLAVDLNALAQVLIASGIPGFENPVRAYLFSMLPVCVAVGLKSLPRFIRLELDQRIYASAVWVIGLTAGVIWFLLFARHFPSITQSTSELINSLTLGSAPATHSGNGWLVFFQLLAGTFLAGGSWITIEHIVRSHAARRRIRNQAYLLVERDLNAAIKAREEQEAILGEVCGRIKQIEALEEVYVARALQAYDYARAVLAGTNLEEVIETTTTHKQKEKA